MSAVKVLSFGEDLGEALFRWGENSNF